MLSVGKRIITAEILFFLIAALAVAGCSSKSGEVLEFKGGRLHYTGNVTKEEANRMGDYLLKVGVFKLDKPAICRLTKKAGVYQLCVVTDKEVIEKKVPADQMSPIEAAGLLAEDISKDVFGGAKVEWHMCDDKFNTLAVGTY